MTTVFSVRSSNRTSLFFTALSVASVQSMQCNQCNAMVFLISSVSSFSFSSWLLFGKPGWPSPLSTALHLWREEVGNWKKKKANFKIEFELNCTQSQIWLDKWSPSNWVCHNIHCVKRNSEEQPTPYNYRKVFTIKSYLWTNSDCAEDLPKKWWTLN